MNDHQNVRPAMQDTRSRLKGERGHLAEPPKTPSEIAALYMAAEAASVAARKANAAYFEATERISLAVRNAVAGGTLKKRTSYVTADGILSVGGTSDGPEPAFDGEPLPISLTSMHTDD